MSSSIASSRSDGAAAIAATVQASAPPPSSSSSLQLGKKQASFWFGEGSSSNDAIEKAEPPATPETPKDYTEPGQVVTAVSATTKPPKDIGLLLEEAGYARFGIGEWIHMAGGITLRQHCAGATATISGVDQVRCALLRHQLPPLLPSNLFPPLQISDLYDMLDDNHACMYAITSTQMFSQIDLFFDNTASSHPIPTTTGPCRCIR